MTASRKPPFVFHRTTRPAASAVTPASTRPIGDASWAALRRRCATASPSVAVFQLLKAPTVCSIFRAAMSAPRPAAIVASSGAIAGRLSLSHWTAPFIYGTVSDTASEILPMRPVTFSEPTAS